MKKYGLSWIVFVLLFFSSVAGSVTIEERVSANEIKIEAVKELMLEITNSIRNEISIAKEALDHRLLKSNQIRSQLDRQAKTFAEKSVVYEKFQNIEEKFDNINKKIDNLNEATYYSEGESHGSNYLITVIIATLVMGMFELFRRKKSVRRTDKEK